MCRYAFHVYKEHFACFQCRKMLRQTAREDLPEYNRPSYSQKRIVICPECGQPLHDMGKDFKPPKQHDVQQWRKVQTLHRHGYFPGCSCGCGGGGPRVSTLGEVRSYLAISKEQAEKQESARQKQVKDNWQQAKRKKHRSSRKPPQVAWQFYP